MAKNRSDAFVYKANTVVFCVNDIDPSYDCIEPSVMDLISLNEELAAKNRQLTAALARLTSEAAVVLERLTPRQHEVMAFILEGHPSKNIAADLGISQRTVENHRAAIMHRTGAPSLPALVRLSLGVSCP